MSLSFLESSRSSAVFQQRAVSQWESHSSSYLCHFNQRQERISGWGWKDGGYVHADKRDSGFWHTGATPTHNFRDLVYVHVPGLFAQFIFFLRLDQSILTIPICSQTVTLVSVLNMYLCPWNTLRTQWFAGKFWLGFSSFISVSLELISWISNKPPLSTINAVTFLSCCSANAGWWWVTCVCVCIWKSHMNSDPVLIHVTVPIVRNVSNLEPHTKLTSVWFGSNLRFCVFTVVMERRGNQI